MANPAFFACFAPYLEVLSGSADPEHLPFQRVYVNGSFLDGDRLVSWPARLADMHAAWAAEGRAPLARLGDSLSADARRALRSLGLPEGAWYVALHVRDGSYRMDRGFAFRNADLTDVLPAVRAIVAVGGWVVRVGDAEAALPSEPGLVDYARSPLRSPALDVAIAAKARFFLGTSSGLVMVPLAFGVPCIQVNVAPIAARAYASHDLFLPKLYREREMGRLWPFPKAMRSPLARAFQDRMFDEAGVEVVANTPEEIRDVTLEMLQRLEGREADSAEDEGRQRRYLAASPDRWGGSGARVGKAFLARYEALLD